MSTMTFPPHLQHQPGPPLPIPRWVPAGALAVLVTSLLSAATRLEFSSSISLSIARFKYWLPRSTRSQRLKYALMTMVATFSMIVMGSPGFPLKLAIPALYILGILLPFSSQFLLPASPILLWLLFFYSSGFLAPSTRPHIWVSVLSTLETIWYGANISDILSYTGHPVLDVLAWVPYGIVHFAAPFFVAAFLFVFGPPGSVKFFGSAFGFMNLIGVIIQVTFPTAPPWYELREGLTPANYSMKGSPAGLARIDALFGGHGYTVTFTNAPVPFGAFPSLHAGCATMEALFCSYFFPISIPLGGSLVERVIGKGKKLAVDARLLYWSYAFWLYWCTMYLMHHYLVDLVGGGCLATLCFYFFLDDTQRLYMEESYPTNPSAPAPFSTLQASHSQLHLRTSSRGHDEFALGDLHHLHHHPPIVKDEERGLGNEVGRPSMTLFALEEEEGEDSTLGVGKGDASGRGSRSITPRPKTPTSAHVPQKTEVTPKPKPGQSNQSGAGAQDDEDSRSSFDRWA